MNENEKEKEKDDSNPFDIILSRLDALESKLKEANEENEKLKNEIKVKDQFINANSRVTIEKNKKDNITNDYEKMLEEQRKRYKII